MKYLALPSDALRKPFRKVPIHDSYEDLIERVVFEGIQRDEQHVSRQT